MQTPSNDELRRLTPAINALIAEEADLHGIAAPALLTPAMVRSVAQVFAEEAERRASTERKRKVFEILRAIPPETRSEVPVEQSAPQEVLAESKEPVEEVETPKVTEEPVVDAVVEAAPVEPDVPPAAEPELSASAAAILGPEHVVVSPLVDKPKPAAARPWRGLLAAVGTDVEDLRMGTEEKAALMREIIYALQDMAFNEEMPSQNQWNFNKPESLPVALTILSRWEMSGWGELAERAKLKYHGKGPRRGGRTKHNVSLAPGKRLPALQRQGA